MQVIGFGRFQATRFIFETRIIDEDPKPFDSDLALTDVRMPIHARTKGRFGIIQMKGQDLL